MLYFNSTNGYLYIITIAWVLFWICFCKDIKIFLQLTRWSIIGWEKGVKIVEKKSRNYLEVAWKSPYLCTRFERETPLESDKNRFWKILKKSSEILWRFRKMTYLCTRFECNTRFETIRKKVLKKFWKILSKRFGGSKINTYLCTTFRWKIAVRTAGGAERQTPEK